MGRLGKSKIFPELAFFESEEERKKVLKRYERRRFRDWRFGGYVIVSSAVLSLVTSVLGLTGVLDRLWDWMPGWSRNTLIGLAAVSGASIALGGLDLLWRKPVRRFLREQLVAKGVPICLHCGYGLRGQVEPRCPECGKAFSAALLKHKPGVHCEQED